MSKAVSCVLTLYKAIVYSYTSNIGNSLNNKKRIRYVTCSIYIYNKSYPSSLLLA